MTADDGLSAQATASVARHARTPWRGHPYPLGATWDGAGVNFAIYSENAEGVELCLFDPKGRRELERVALRERTDFIWHGYLPDARPGQLYGYRVHGRYDPARGLRFNHHKLLLDPYAKMIVGSLRWNDALFGYRAGGRREDLAIDMRDSASAMPKCQVIDPAFTWGNDRPPQTPWKDTVIYEMHVKGFSHRNPAVPPQLRGTYAGLATAPSIAHLKGLGVTAVELMPVHAFVDDKRLVERGMRNYWGYNSIGFFAPEMRYSSTGTLGEFKTMVKALHAAHIEVILDVVYNHTAEGNHLGPTLAFRGIDNGVYYRLGEDPRYYVDYTGTGNTLTTMHPIALRLIMDSLRYWVTEMHVDGFRFDLATALTREAHDVDRAGAFLDILRQDPVLSPVKLIAEPWDLGENGYQVGGFPPGWSEWNGRYRDDIRAYWKGDGGLAGEMASRLSGSSDIFAPSGRGPTSSINFITAHDGFTLQDLVSYNDKHNAANGEDNSDGESHNRSWNCGVEGPTDDPAIIALRARQKRNLIATLLFSQGVPMLLAGDELGRSQGGNNNAYCQDNEVTWLDWTLTDDARVFLAFVERIVALRKQHPLFQRRTFFVGRGVQAVGPKDIVWLNPDGNEMTDAQWNQSSAQAFGAQLSGRGVTERDEHGRPVDDDDLVLLLNAHYEPVAFRLPAGEGAAWEPQVDTGFDDGNPELHDVAPGAEYPLQGRSLVLLRRAR